jgi:hypothetical protein
MIGNAVFPILLREAVVQKSVAHCLVCTGVLRSLTFSRTAGRNSIPTMDSHVHVEPPWNTGCSCLMCSHGCFSVQMSATPLFIVGSDCFSLL